MSLARLQALLYVSSARLDEKETDDFILPHLRYLANFLLSFDSKPTDFHVKLLEPRLRLLDALLPPVCGPEDNVDDEDRKTLPPRLRTLVGNPLTIRSNSKELKSTICQALLQGTYYVMREMHKFEAAQRDVLLDKEPKSEEVVAVTKLLYDVEQVVDQLICEEYEREPSMTESSLRKIEVDDEMAKKMEDTKADYLSID